MEVNIHSTNSYAPRGISSSTQAVLEARTRQMADSTQCPVGMLRQDGRCHFNKELCHCVDNGSPGLGLSYCEVIPVIHAIADGRIRPYENQLNSTGGENE